MKLARLNRRSGVLPELLVFACARCAQAEIRKPPGRRDDPSLRIPTPSTVR